MKKKKSKKGTNGRKKTVKVKAHKRGKPKHT